MSAAAPSAIDRVPARAARTRSPLLRFRSMVRVGLRMMVHDKLKMLGTLVGVVFAVLLSNQQAGTFMGLLKKNTMFIESAGADLWILPPNTETLAPGKPLPEALSKQARGIEGVAWCEPLLFGGGQVAIPGGSSEAVTIVGTRLPGLRGGPWNMVAGDPRVLASPDTMIFEDGVRDTLGGLNLGSVREVNGRKVQVGGFTWGLLPFGPAYAFAEYDLARSLLHVDADRANFILVGVAPGKSPAAVRDAIAQRFPEVKVVTSRDFARSTIRYLLIRSAIGVTFGTSTIFGLVVGFVIVALTTFSAVIDNIREFGTLKAIGATTWDLAKLLFAQSVAYALLGSLIGLTLVTRVADAVRSPKFAIIITPALALGTTFMMLVLCVMASSFALVRLRKLEPAMVFR
ncbi:ABC transporter, permease protein [Minicystis rosea]|nr:ABC transporter, permease protein [Minicystis rosea]